MKAQTLRSLLAFLTFALVFGVPLTPSGNAVPRSVDALFATNVAYAEEEDDAEDEAGSEEEEPEDETE